MPELEPVKVAPFVWTDEDRARLQATLSEIGRQFREHMVGIMRDLRVALQPTIDAVIALGRAFEAAGLYDLDPAEIRIGLLEDAADDYADAYRDTPQLGFTLAERATCAHVCGPDPDHMCQAAATMELEHQNLAGGTTRTPMCSPCHAAETAAMEAADA